MHAVAAETVRVVRKKLICWLAARLSSVVWGDVRWLDTRHRIASVRQCAEPSPRSEKANASYPGLELILNADKDCEADFSIIDDFNGVLLTV